MERTPEEVGRQDVMKAGAGLTLPVRSFGTPEMSRGL